MNGQELLFVFAMVILGSFVTLQLSKAQNQTSESSLSQPIIQVLPAPVTTRGGDDRYTMAPRPQRLWDIGPEIPVRGALDPYAVSRGEILKNTHVFQDPIPTRGAPDEYQQMGVIVGADNKPLPLYGRRVAPRSDRFNYYTRTDTYNPVALPVLAKRRDCQDNLGCDELFNGDDVRIGATGEVMKVTMYGFDGPRYIG
jgi:hypothetical protein